MARTKNIPLSEYNKIPIHFMNLHFGHLRPSWEWLKTVARTVLCLLAVCWHGVHSASHEYGLTLLQRTKRAHDCSARSHLLCSPPYHHPVSGLRLSHVPSLVISLPGWWAAELVTHNGFAFFVGNGLKEINSKMNQVQLKQGRKGEVGRIKLHLASEWW